MSLAKNPNQTRPVLSIGRKPLALEAFKAKIKLVKKPVFDLPPKDQAGEGDIRKQVRHAELRDIHHAGDTHAIPAFGPGVGNRDFPDPLGNVRSGSTGQEQQHPPFTGGHGLQLQTASEPFTKPVHPLLPFTAINTGTVSDLPVSWTTPAERAAALHRWVCIIAREVMRSFPAGSPDRPSAKTFAFGHRLSIAHAFERRIMRRDVVAALAALYAEHQQMDVSRDNVSPG